MSFNKLSDILLQNLNIHTLQISLSPNEITYLHLFTFQTPIIKVLK
jgi:hypothetical protein